MQADEQRTNLVLNTRVIKDIMDMTGLKTKKDVVNEALRLMRQRLAQKQMASMYGKIEWEGNLEQMRLDS